MGLSNGGALERLELHGVSLGDDSRIYQLAGHVRVAGVVHPGFSDYEAGMPGTNLVAVYFNHFVLHISQS